MKPLKLAMQAFGPFAGRQEVDFAALGEQALFLIHGPTGAGKTTLLDAICFALYGDTSGGERDARAMRSDHAPATLATEVAFEFALGSERYRVVRQPQQRRPKQRGEGFTEAPATAQLDRLQDGEWTSLASQPGKVGARVCELIGFDSTQFRQVIVLPQGRFRELLTARSDEREAILQTLFRTEHFRLVADELKRRAKALEEQAKAIAIRRQTVLQQAEAESVEALDARREALQAEQAALQPQQAQGRERVAAAGAALERGRADLAALDELAVARAAEAALCARQGEIDALRAEQAAARRAEPLRPLDAAVADAGRAVDDAQRRRHEALDMQVKARTACEAAQAALAREQARAPEREAAARRIGELEALSDKVAALAAATRLRDDTARRGEDLRARLKHEQAGIERLRAQDEAAHQRLDTLRSEGARAEALQLQLDAAESLRTRLHKLATTRAEAAKAQQGCEAAEAAVKHADKALAAARATLDALEKQWRAGHAARLAATLHAGEACPVCGSREHPEPARADTGAEPVDDAAIDAAREALQAASGVRESALARRHAAERPLLGAQAVLAELEQGLGDALPAAGAEAAAIAAQQQAIAALAAASAAAAKAAAECAPLAAAIEGLGRELVAAGERSRKLDADLGTAQVELAAAAREAELLQAAVPEALRTPQALQAATAAVRRTREELERALQQADGLARQAATQLAAAEASCGALAGECERARQARTLAAERFAAALAEAGFADEAQYRAALREAAALARLETTIADHQQALAAAKDRLARAVQAAAGRSAPDITTLEAELAGAKAALEAVLARLQTLAAHAEAATRARAALARLADEGAELDARYATLGRLAEVAGGINPRRMTFQRFVLATLLDEVLEAASLRLTRMSRSRFELRRVLGVTDQRVAGGLELEVFDHYTGTARPANTLSGGEGFLASLSLALGLADVVQSRAGGIQMETLFIDEGFGTLDPESLDFALRTLIDLQQAGRMVGVISHVAELRERIDVRLELRAAARGSEIRLVR